MHKSDRKQNTDKSAVLAYGLKHNKSFGPYVVTRGNSKGLMLFSTTT